MVGVKFYFQYCLCLKVNPKQLLLQLREDI